MKLKNYCFAEQYFNLFTNYFLKMLAVIELWGNQFTVKQWDIIDVKKLDKEINASFDVSAMLVSDEEGKETKFWINLNEKKSEFLKWNLKRDIWEIIDLELD